MWRNKNSHALLLRVRNDGGDGCTVNVNVLRTTELYTEKWPQLYILCNAYFTTHTRNLPQNLSWHSSHVMEEGPSLLECKIALFMLVLVWTPGLFTHTQHNLSKRGSPLLPAPFVPPSITLFAFNLPPLKKKNYSPSLFCYHLCNFSSSIMSH